MGLTCLPATLFTVYRLILTMYWKFSFLTREGKIKILNFKV